ncbi:MAG TPA: type IX secretion system outer membrane channel protein PorV [Luteibaculaceae bacterium]|nr:type IX secretion system outer membrane channel protein PorV [Luteibaculaceae bacterium]
MKHLIFAAALGLSAVTVLGQGSIRRSQINGADINTITTAVPFLTINPDSKGGAMGDVGVSSSPDALSTFWNPSKLAFAESDFGASLSYVPWLRTIVPDMSLSYLSMYSKINANSAVGGSFRYFNMGSITFTDENATTIRDFTPAEFALDLNYSIKLSERFATGVALRYINSNLTGGTVVQGAATKAGNAVAFDLSAYYRSKAFKLGGKNSQFTGGLTISNVGTKMNYSTSAEPNFLPTMLRLGPGLQVDLDEYQRVSLFIDITKLLVPTPPIYALDSNGAVVVDADGQKQIESGKNPEVTVTQGIFQSFNDAPGGFAEELREYNLSVGAEYLYNKQFAVRTGYFFEHPTKGNRQFISMGAGLKYSVLDIDLSYLIPTSTVGNSPLGNTLRITLKVGLTKSSKSEPATDVKG